MGMFDNVVCYYQLPLGTLPAEVLAIVMSPGHMFQTKDLSGNLNTMIIDVNGKLWIRSHSEAHKAPVRCDFSGDMCFYARVDTSPGQRGTWVQYGTRFIEGQLTQIVDISSLDIEGTLAAWLEKNSKVNYASRRFYEVRVAGDGDAAYFIEPPRKGDYGEHQYDPQDLQSATVFAKAINGWVVRIQEATVYSPSDDDGITPAKLP